MTSLFCSACSAIKPGSEITDIGISKPSPTFSAHSARNLMDNLTIWHEAFRILCDDVPEFRYPDWFDYLGVRVPTEESRARRDVPRFLSFLEAIALCRSFSDGRHNKSKEIEINFADYCVAYPILREAFASTYAGAHPMAMEFARAVRQLCRGSKKHVTTKEVATHLGWTEAVAHKWRVESVKQKLVQYKPGTFPQNQKPLLPGPAEHATAFLPDPHLVFEARPELGKVVKYTCPLSGEHLIMRRR